MRRLHASLVIMAALMQAPILWAQAPVAWPPVALKPIVLGQSECDKLRAMPVDSIALTLVRGGVSELANEFLRLVGPAKADSIMRAMGKYAASTPAPAKRARAVSEKRIQVGKERELLVPGPVRTDTLRLPEEVVPVLFPDVIRIEEHVDGHLTVDVNVHDDRAISGPNWFERNWKWVVPTIAGVVATDAVLCAQADVGCLMSQKAILKTGSRDRQLLLGGRLAF